MKTFVVIATYNELDNIEKLVPAIFRILPDTNLLIVDDNSPDGTSNLVTELKDRYPGLHLVTRSGKLGYGTAFIRGFEYALEHDTEIIVTMDADFSHDPEEIPRFSDLVSHSAEFPAKDLSPEVVILLGQATRVELAVDFGRCLDRSINDFAILADECRRGPPDPRSRPAGVPLHPRAACRPLPCSLPHPPQTGARCRARR